MKTAISLPDELFERAERLARRMKKSRSQVYADALAEYVARYSPELVTEGWDEACEEAGEAADAFVETASRQGLERSEW